MRPTNRRSFLGLTGGLLLGAAARADERGPAPEGLRATSGDDVAEPNWDERFGISVGVKNADLVGSTERVIQAAVDYAARMGGGTIHIGPGTYRFRNAVYLPSKIRIVGSGEDTIIIKEPSVSATLSADSDWYDREVTLTDAKGFQVGDGVCFRAKNPDNGGQTVVKRTLIARSGNRFKLDRAPRENLWLRGDPKVSTLFPLFSGEFISDVVIEKLVLDGNKSNNENLDGNYAGCVFLQDCNRVTIRDVTGQNYNGDGFSWQICHDVHVENCRSLNNVGLGYHPGSGSQRPRIRNNVSRGNDIGIYFCWGVRFGLAEGNTVEDNKSHGVSIGHRDTDNTVRDNKILRSGKVGVLFRPENVSFGPHRNRLENNTILDSGPDSGVGIDVQGETEAVTLAKNEVRETRSPMSRVGIRIGAKAKEIKLAENRVEGYSVSVSDLRAR